MTLRLVFLFTLAAALGAVAEEPWLARAFIPSSNNVHGEIRLLQRGDTACVQTLLYSKYLRRGLHEMTKQESLAWPDNWPCCEVSTNYLANLHTVRDTVLSEAMDNTNDLRRLIIEFSLGPASATYAIGTLSLEGPADALQVTQPRLLASTSAHPYYVSRAMALMCEQGFGLRDQDLLTKAGWTNVVPPEQPIERQFVPR